MMTDDKTTPNLRVRTGTISKKPDPAKPNHWRSFPVFESLLEHEQPALFDRIQSTCRQLEAILKQGSPHEKDRARKALTAYERTLELYQELFKNRNEILSQAGNQGGAPHDK